MKANVFNLAAARDDRLRNTGADAPVLVVGDNAADVRLLARFLKRLDCSTVATAADARTAVRAHLALRTEVVVVDVDMKGADVFEVMEQLQCATSPDARPPVFVLTGEMSPQAREDAVAGGVKGFLKKPLDYSEVAVCISNLLETRALRLQLTQMAKGISNCMSVIRNYAGFVISGIDQRADRGEQGWSEIRRDAEEIQLAVERSAAYSNHVLRHRSAGAGT
ncbi:MAG: response regulator [Actinobacteria bacterium]|nr:response regulator [Actinomycetota bacterium]MBW3648942.1 response regulator [Actinomycetota bacterium]